MNPPLGNSGARGKRGGEPLFVNGMDTTHLVTGLSDQEAIVDFLDVVRVQTTGFGADQRAATGGVIQAVTKSGSNQWRGSVGLFATRAAGRARHARRCSSMPKRERPPST